MRSEHEVIVKMVERVRNRLKEADQSRFRLDIEVHGEVQTGKPKMCYKLSKDTYGSAVEGNDIDEVLTEHLRRCGWVERNKPLELTFNSDEEDEEDREHII